MTILEKITQTPTRIGGATFVGVILTGMGKDGAEGMLELRKTGAMTLGQDEASSLIYGMPRAAFERGAVARQFSLSHMPDAIVDACNGDFNPKGNHPAADHAVHAG